MTDIIEQAEAALDGVTEGPWISWKGREGRGRNEGGIYHGNVVSDATKQIVVSQTGNVANSRFVAAARTLVPELVAALKAARAENDRLRPKQIDPEKLKTCYRCGRKGTQQFIAIGDAYACSWQRSCRERQENQRPNRKRWNAQEAK